MQRVKAEQQSREKKKKTQIWTWEMREIFQIHHTLADSTHVWVWTPTNVDQGSEEQQQ